MCIRDRQIAGGKIRLYAADAPFLELAATDVVREWNVFYTQVAAVFHKVSGILDVEVGFRDIRNPVSYTHL